MDPNFLEKSLFWENLQVYNQTTELKCVAPVNDWEQHPQTTINVRSTHIFLLLCHPDWWSIPSLLRCQRTGGLGAIVSTHARELSHLHTYPAFHHTRDALHVNVVFLRAGRPYLSLHLCQSIKLHVKWQPITTQITSHLHQTVLCCAAHFLHPVRQNVTLVWWYL